MCRAADKDIWILANQLQAKVFGLKIETAHEFSES
jgi:hypothetical protein